MWWFTLLLIWGPYFPIGFGIDRIRVDHPIVYALGVAAVFGGEHIPRRAVGVVFLYGLMYTYMCFASLLPIPFDNWRIGSLLGGIDAYLRPMVVFVTALSLRLTAADFHAILRLVVISLPGIVVIGGLSLMPGIEGVVNPWVDRWYSGAGEHSSGTLYRAIISGGRTPSIFGQVGNFALYCLMVLMICAAEFTSPRRVIGKYLAVGGLLSGVVGGVISGSKVFPGSIVVIGLLVLFRSPRAMSIILNPRLVVPMVAIAVVGGFAVYFADPLNAEKFGSFVAAAFTKPWVFIEGRFASTDLVESKLVRTGAIAAVQDYYYCGLGIRAIPITTDSMLVGLLVMGGIWAIGLFVAVIAKLFVLLRNISTMLGGTYEGALADFWAILTVAFFFVAVGFHSFIQDRSGDIYWLIAGVLIRVGLGQIPVGHPSSRRRLERRPVPRNIVPHGEKESA